MDKPSVNLQNAMARMPFCYEENITVEFKEETIWSNLPGHCRSASVALVVFGTIIAFVNIIANLATIVSYSSLNDDILKKEQKWKSRDNNITRRHGEITPKIREADEYVLTMKVQKRLRMLLALFEMIFGVLVFPLIVSSSSRALNMQDESVTEDFQFAVSGLAHLSLTGSIFTAICMALERFDSVYHIDVRKHFSSWLDNPTDKINQSTPRTRDKQIGRHRIACGTHFTVSLLVSILFSIVMTVTYQGKVISFGDHSNETVPGVIQYGSNSYPNVLYIYCGLLIVPAMMMIAVLVILNICICILKKRAGKLDGYDFEKVAFIGTKNKKPVAYIDECKFDDTNKGCEITLEPANIPVNREYRLAKLSSNDSANRLSYLMVNDLPPPNVRYSRGSLDNLSEVDSLPPPPDIVMSSQNSTRSKSQGMDETRVAAINSAIWRERARAFFGNIRETKVVTITAFLIVLVSIPIIVINIYVYLEFFNKSGSLITSFITVTPSNKPDGNKIMKLDRVALLSNLASMFWMLRLLGGVLPCTVFCFYSPLFRCEVLRFLSAVFLFKWNKYGRWEKKCAASRFQSSKRSNREMGHANVPAILQSPVVKRTIDMSIDFHARNEQAWEEQSTRFNEKSTPRLPGYDNRRESKITDFPVTHIGEIRIGNTEVCSTVI